MMYINDICIIADDNDNQIAVTTTLKIKLITLVN